MIRETWCFWLLLLSFIINIIMVLIYANGYKKNITWDSDLSDRLVGIVVTIGYLIILAIALGWL